VLEHPGNKLRRRLFGGEIREVVLRLPQEHVDVVAVAPCPEGRPLTEHADIAVARDDVRGSAFQAGPGDDARLPAVDVCPRVRRRLCRCGSGEGKDDGEESERGDGAHGVPGRSRRSYGSCAYLMGTMKEKLVAAKLCGRGGKGAALRTFSRMPRSTLSDPLSLASDRPTRFPPRSTVRRAMRAPCGMRWDSASVENRACASLRTTCIT